MTLEELKISIDRAMQSIAEQCESLQSVYAELGRELYPALADGEYPQLAEKIKTAEANLNALKNEQSAMENEYRRLVESVTCFYCRHINADDAVFCEECGKRLGEKPREYCETCGTINNPGQKFCGECGAKLKDLI
ncbi:MAG: zinc ribbon domain-containing protein [Oscillospiraceae bacterium]|nr:zinc ribbon domain-containing protein [Oscillospiraceae bacterium]